MKASRFRMRSMKGMLPASSHRTTYYRRAAGRVVSGRLPAAQAYPVLCSPVAMPLMVAPKGYSSVAGSVLSNNRGLVPKKQRTGN